MSDAAFRALARAAAQGYARNDRFARHFAYGKLTGDPAFAWLLRERLVRAGARVLDLGCGQGLLAALLLAARIPPASYIGVDVDAREVERARAMAASRSGAVPVEFRAGDIRSAEFPASDVVVVLDVLHYVDPVAQREVLRRATTALAPGGMLLLRVADASSTLRLRWTLGIDALSQLLRGRRPAKTWPRPVAEWRAELERLGLAVSAVPMSAGTLFANVALMARYDSPR